MSAVMKAAPVLLEFPATKELPRKLSGFEINPCRFYDTNEDALEDMRRLAEGL